MALNSKKGQIFNEINITPLTDIFLVLLIIMMFVAPMFQSSNEHITMPEINSGISIEEDANNVVISITKNNHYYLNSKQISQETITDELLALSKKTEDKKIIIKADTAVKSKEIINIVKAAQDTGFEKLVIAGEPLSKKAQDKLENKNIKPVKTTKEQPQEPYYEPEENFDFEE